MSSLPIGDLTRGSAIKFDNVGDRVKGIVTNPRREQQRDFDTGSPMTWDNGDPRLQTVVGMTVDGEERTLYARGGKYEVVEGEGTSLEAAIVEAVVAAGASDIAEGAELEVVHTGLGKPPRKGANSPKLYRAKYTPPRASVPVSDLFSTPS